MAKRLSEAKDSEIMLEIASQEGFEFDLEEAKKAKEELSDEDLASVVDGEGMSDTKRIVCMWSEYPQAQ